MNEIGWRLLSLGGVSGVIGVIVWVWAMRAKVSAETGGEIVRSANALVGPMREQIETLSDQNKELRAELNDVQDQLADVRRKLDESQARETKLVERVEELTELLKEFTGAEDH